MNMIEPDPVRSARTGAVSQLTPTPPGGGLPAHWPAQARSSPTVDPSPWWLETETVSSDVAARSALALADGGVGVEVDDRDMPGRGMGTLLPGSGQEPYFLAPGVALPPSEAARAIDMSRLVRDDFPALREEVSGRRLVWLDSAATTQKPQVVIDRLRRFYEVENSNVHRAAHSAAARATEIYEGARATVARFIGATDSSEIIFTRSTTESINLVAYSAGAYFVSDGDEILLSELEHHSNIVPWQLLAERTGARVRSVPVDDDGNLRLDQLERLLNDRTRIVAVTAASNAIGTIVPLQPVIAAAHAYGALVLVDGAQSVAHLPLSVSALDIDFFAFSGHKIFGPTGIGALYGKRHLLEAMPPWQGGGSMIDHVTLDRSTYAAVPAKFEAGTGHIAGAAGLATALGYVERLGPRAIGEYEHGLMNYLVNALGELPGACIVGNPSVRGSAVSFVIDGIEPGDIAAHLDGDGIAVRAGHHCAQPILRRLGYTQTVRPSIAVYNSEEDVDYLMLSLHRLVSGPNRDAKAPAGRLSPMIAPELYKGDPFR